MSRLATHVDIIMSHFDESDFLSQALDSIVAQRFEDWTLHFVDDCSANHNWKGCLSVYQCDDRVRCYQTTRNVGHYRIKNALIPRLDGPLVAFHDNDDVSHENRLHEQVEAFQKRRVDILGCSFAHISRDGVATGIKRMVRNANFGLAIGRRFVLLQPTMLTRLDVLLALNGFDGTARIAADSDFVLRASHFFRIRNLRRVLYLKRRHERSLTESPSTGFGSVMREEYRNDMLARHTARRTMRGEDLRKAALAPDNDVDFALERV